MSSDIPCSSSRQNQRDCTPSFIVAMKGESPDEQQTTNKSSAHWAHSNQGLNIESNRELVSGAQRVRWGNLGLNWAFFEINRVSSQSRLKY